jgi:Secretion system C-terminal sorting domain
MKNLFALLIFIAIFCNKSSAQIVVTYPKLSDSITKNLDSTFLTVQVAFGGACTNTNVTISFPIGVEYIAGSVVKNAGSLTSSSIVESNISDKRKPIFAINGISGPGDIQFKVKRKAGCNSGTSGKDTILVNSSCGTILEDEENKNTYNINVPVLSITPPVAINNAVLNGTYNRNTSIINGGAASCIDTLRFYIVYSGGGIELINNTLFSNGNPILPYRTNGDTLFFKAFGKTLFGSTGLLCNGVSFSITENIRVKKCTNLNTLYQAGWGKSEKVLCESVSASASVTLVNGSPGPTASINTIQSLSYCRNGIYTITYSNTGSGGNAGTMYNISTFLGHNLGYTTAFPPVKNYKVNILNVQINGSPLAVNLVNSTIAGWTSELVYQIPFNQFTADPDGVGIGLEDLDGDGQFDDLAPGKSVTLNYEEKWNCYTTCPTPQYNFAPRAQINYTNWCNELTILPNLIKVNPYWHYLSSIINATAPGQVVGGVPFNTQMCLSGQMSPPAHRPTDSVYFEVTYPPGFSFVGNVLFNGTIVPTSNYSFVNNKFTFTRKGYLVTGCITFDMVYNCGINADVNINYKIRYVGDNSCNCEECIDVADIKMNLKCPVPCKTGIINYAPTVKRLSLGYTDKTLTKKVSPSLVTGLALRTALPKDTILMTIPGKQIDKFDNLNYYYQIPRSTLKGESVLKFIEGVLYHNSISSGKISSCVVDNPTITLKNNYDVYQFDLTSCLQNGTIETDDSVWLEVKYVVTTAENGYLYGNQVNTVPNTLSYFYNVEGSGQQIFCDTWNTDFALCGLKLLDEPYGATDIVGCNEYYINGDLRSLNLEGSDIFPNEYRPTIQIDSIVVTLPAGYQYNPNWATSMEMSYWGNISSAFTYPRTTVIPIINGNKVTLINPKNGTWNLSDLSKQPNFSQNRYFIPVKPTCAAPIGSAQGGLSIYAKNYFYADKIGEQYTGLHPNNFTTFLGLKATDKPSISLANNTGVVAGASNQEFWDISINNPGNTNAPSVWMAIEKFTGSGIVIDSVVYKPTNAIATPINYGLANTWYKVTSTGINGGANQQFRIYFKYKNCTADSIKLVAGWNCDGYPTSPTAYTCQALSQWLVVKPLASQIQLSVLQQPNFPSQDMCTRHTVSVLVSSAAAGDVNNPILKIIPPAGVVIETSIPVEYPYGNGNWQSLPATLVNGEYILNLKNHTGVGVNGLKGTNRAQFPIDRQIRVVLAYETVCGFTNGTKLNFIVQGQSACAQPSVGNNDEVKTNPIIITGSNAVGSAGTTMNISKPDLNCGETDVISVAITPLISSTTNSDTVKITLPLGIQYNPASFSGCPSCSITTETGSGFSTIVKIKLPNNEPANTPINFSIGVNAALKTDCRAYPIEVQTIRTGVLLQCNAQYCSQPTPVVLSTATANILVKKVTLQVLEFKLLGNEPYNPGGTYSTSFKVQNGGTLNAPAGYIAEVFCLNEVAPFASITLPAMAINQIITLTQNITLPLTCAGGSALIVRIKKDVTLPMPSVQCLCQETDAITAKVLPVKLISFKAVLVNSNTMITFKIANEKIGTKYNIQRSTDGLTFYNINEITVAQILSGDYIFNDKNLNDLDNKIFYRLQIVDQYGVNQYSEIVSINKLDKTGGLIVTPNPAKSSVEVKFYASKNQTVQILIFDVKGNKIKQWSKQVIKGYNTVLLNDLQVIAAGAYVIQVNNNSINYKTKLNITK